MQPRYRGIPYSRSGQSDDATPANAALDMRHYPFQVRLLGHRAVEMTYRGVRYTR